MNASPGNASQSMHAGSLHAIRSPVFIVGASRSGTSMMQAMLQCHPAISIQGETHYFDDLRLRMDGGHDRPIEDEAIRRRVEDYFLAIEHRPYGHGGDPEQGPLPRQTLRDAANELGGSADAYFEAFCKLEALKADATIWGEKTPRHIFRLGDMLQSYQDARAICMVRDARAVVASYRDWKYQGGFDLEHDPGHERALQKDIQRTKRSYHIIIASLLWRGAVRSALHYQQHFGVERVRIQRYEFLVREPEREIRDLCEWLGVPFDESMLVVPMRNSSYAAFSTQSGFDATNIERWRHRLAPREIGIIQRICKKELQRAGYALDKVRFNIASWLWAWITFPFAVLRAILSNRERIARLPSYLLSRLHP